MAAEVPGGDVVWDRIWTARVSLGRQKPWASLPWVGIAAQAWNFAQVFLENSLTL